MTKTKLYALTYHPRKNGWSGKVIKSQPKRREPNTSYARGTSMKSAWMKMSRKSYLGETGRRK